MSTCLTVTKGIAISSLGLYAGIVSAGTLLVVNDRVTPTNDSKHDLVRTLLCKVGTGLNVVATVVFGLVYFSSPGYARHPYLVYAALTGPATSLYMFLSKRYWLKQLRNLKETKITDEKHSHPPVGQDAAQTSDKAEISYAAAAAVGAENGGELSESVVDLGIEKTIAQAEKDFEKQKAAEVVRRETQSIKVRAVATAVIATVGFIQSVIGVSGEHL